VGKTLLADDSEAALERALVEEFLSDQGHSFDDLPLLDDDHRERLMLEAAVYAALRLGERAYLGTSAEF
jgi:hypothetical protein